MPLCAVDGMAVTTVEGIGSTKTALHPVQVIKALRNVIRNDSWFSINKCQQVVVEGCVGKGFSMGLRE